MQGQRTVRITREHRDALRGAVLCELSGIGDILVALSCGDGADAQRLRARFETDMELLDDLGWDEHTDQQVFEITLAPARLGPMVHRFRAGALECLAQDRDGLLKAERELATGWGDDASVERGAEVDLDAAQALAAESRHAIDELLDEQLAYDAILKQLGEGVA